MADRTRTTTYRAVTASAVAQIKKLKESLLGTSKATTTTVEGLEELKKAQKKLADDIKGGKGYKELQNRLESLTDTMQEFGFSTLDQQKALAAVRREALRTGQPVALVAKAAEFLADEGEQAADVSRDLALALRLAEVAGLKTEDAGRLLGAALRGETDALRKLGPVAARAADQIDKIADPSIRAKETMRVLRRETGQTATAIRKGSSGLKAMASRLGLVGKALVALTALFSTFTFGVGGAFLKVMEGYTKQSVRFQKAQKASNKAVERFTWELGGVITNALMGSKQVGGLTRVIDSLTKHVRANRRTIADFVRQAAITVVGIMGAAAKGIGGLLQGVMGAIATAMTAFGSLLSKMAYRYRDLQRFLGFKDVGQPVSKKMFETSATLKAEAGALRQLAAGVGLLGGKINSVAAGLAGSFTGAMGQDVDLGKKAPPGGGGSGADRQEALTEARRGGRFLGLDTIGGIRGRARAMDTRRQLRGIAAGMGDARARGEAENPDASLSALNELTRSLPERMDAVLEKIAQANQAFTDLANGAIAAVTGALGDMMSQMVQGTFSVGNFAKGLIGTFGGLFRQVGEGMMLLSLGVKSIAAGITNPVALFGIGAGLALIGGAMEGFAASRSGGGGGGGSAAAVQQGFTQGVDRYLDAQKDDRPLIVQLEEDGFKRVIARSVRGLQEDRLLGAL